MATTIPQRALRSDNARVLDAVARGESFLITRHGHPIAELRPVSDQRRTFVPISELSALSASASAVDLAAFRADTDGLLDGRVFSGGSEANRP